MDIAGAICFGVVMGWVTYRTLRRNADKVGLSDIATVLGAVGGAAVTTLFDDDKVFGGYAIGLAAGFFGYLMLSMILEGKKVASWMGAQSETAQPPRPANERPTN
jgi:O-antigen/teichoic acid export membrane protein